MVTINDAPRDGRSSVQIIATITDIYCESERCDKPILVLSDATGEMCLIVGSTARSALSQLRWGQVVQVTARPCAYDWGCGGLADKIVALGPGEIVNRALALPKRRCPVIAQHALLSLADMVGSLKSTLIRSAINELIDVAAEGLLQSPASRSHHHAYPGGLLVHTVDVMQLSLANADRVFQGQLGMRDLAVFLALAHDIGKTRFASINAEACPITAVYPHEHLGLLILLPVLEKMADKDAPMALRLAEALKWLSQPRRLRRIGVSRLGEVVQMADEMSVMSERESYRTRWRVA